MVPVPNETARYFIGSATREALLGLHLEPRWQDALEKGVADLESALARLDAELLTESLDELAAVALARLDRADTVAPVALVLRDVLDALYAAEASASTASSLASTRALRRALLEWWYEAWLGHLGRDQLRAYLSHPRPTAPVEAEVRTMTREQLTGYPASAKEKLLRELEAEREQTRLEAEELRRQGRDAEADRRDSRRVGYGWALDEVEASISG